MDGSLDGSWNSAGVGIDSDLSGVADFAFYGSYIYITGRFTSYNGVARNRIARLNLTDGTLDTGWDPGAGLNDPSGGPAIYGAISVDATGVYVGGNFTTYDGVTRGGIAKINHNATLNTTFAADIGFRTPPFTAPLFLGGVAQIFDIELNGVPLLFISF